MNARDLFDQGRLDHAIAVQNEVVKVEPTNVDARHELSVYLCFAGNLDRAFLQLNTMGQQEPELTSASHVYRSLLIADLQRRKTFHEDASPLLPPDCAPHVEARWQALKALRAENPEGAAAHLERASQTEGNRPGKLNGEAFAGICDYDDLLGSVLEVYAGETYLWLPFDDIRRLEVSRPKHLLDLLYVPAQLEDVHGKEASVHLPTTYEGSYANDDGQLAIGQKTAWDEIPGVGYRGVGQRLLFCSTESETREVGLLEVQTLEFDTAVGDDSDVG